MEGSSNFGFKKEDVSNFVDYVIKKTEENILTIKNQKEEIDRLREELAIYKRLENNYYDLNKKAEEQSVEIRNIAKKEAEVLISEAKDNASRIFNDALLKAQEVKKQQQELNKNIYNYKKKLRSMLIAQLEEVEDIEML